MKPIAKGEIDDVAPWLARMDAMLIDAGVQHFTARELCLLRKAHPIGRFFAIPPESLWPNMLRTLVEVAEPLRLAYGGPITVKAGWRPADYNRAVAGAPNSTHIPFRGLDLDTTDDGRLRRLACDLWVRHPDMGLGMYLGHIHVDTGHRHRFWTGRKSRRLAIEITKARERLEAGDEITKPHDIEHVPRTEGRELMGYLGFIDTLLGIGKIIANRLQERAQEFASWAASDPIAAAFLLERAAYDLEASADLRRDTRVGRRIAKRFRRRAKALRDQAADLRAYAEQKGCDRNPLRRPGT